MEKSNILESNKVKEITLLYSLSVKDLLWVQISSGEVYRVNALNTYHVILDSGYVHEVISAIYFETHISYVIPVEIIINNDDLDFNIETGILLQEKDLLKFAFELKQIELEKEL